jgi:iron complex transport system ATP-binding protein
VVLMGRTAHGGLLARPSAHDHAVVHAALERLGIAALAQRPVTQISGGERQLVLVARALAQEPRCVVLDEPTASLDFGNQGHVLREIRRLAASGLAVLFTTHDPNHALRFADRVLLIRDGGTMAQGPVRELIDGDHLRRLYGAEIEELADAVSGRRAYLPG